MASVSVWTERNELHGTGWKDCTYSAVLMTLVYGGFTKFPLGIWTAQEREALERSDDRPDETGARLIDVITACKRRYGVTPHAATASLATMLSKPGVALLVTGVNGRLPAGHAQRRWDPGFTGPHAVCVVPLGGGKARWYDPLAPSRFAGDAVTTATILKWAYGEYLYSNAGEFAPKPVPKPVVKPVAPKPPPAPKEEPELNVVSYLPGHIATVKPTANVRSAPTASGALLRAVSVAERWEVIGTVAGSVDPDNADPKTKTQWYARWAGHWEYTAFGNVTAITGPVASSALEAQLAAAIAASHAAQNAATTAEADLVAYRDAHSK